MSLMPTIPKMDALPTDLGFDTSATNDDESEEVEGKQILSLLMKLKNAKEQMEKSKKRKLSQQKVQEALEKLSSVANDKLMKHRKHLSVVKGQFAARFKQIRTTFMEADQQLKSFSFARVTEYKTKSQTVLNEMKKLDDEVNRLSIGSGEIVQAEVRRAREQIEMKVMELEGRIRVVESSSAKEDKFSILLKAIIDDLIN